MSIKEYLDEIKKYEYTFKKAAEKLMKLEPPVKR